MVNKLALAIYMARNFQKIRQFFPFLKRTNNFVSSCSLKDVLIDFIKNASKIFLFLKYSKALVSTFLSN